MTTVDANGARHRGRGNGGGRFEQRTNARPQPITQDDAHLGVWAAESAALEPDDWERWIADVQHAAGRGTDGAQQEDGYSLNHYHDLFRAGVGVQAATTDVHRSLDCPLLAGATA